jgi:hypothetical protein
MSGKRASAAAVGIVAGVLLPLACGACSGPAGGTGTAWDARAAGGVATPATAPATAPTTAPDLSDKDTPPAAHWAAIARILERPGVEHDGVYTITVPRDDWDVNIEGMPVPTAAGVASVFHFYRCPCGKTNVVGQFCVADYEVNDVIDALRAEHMQVASIGPMLLYSRTNPQLVRFQAEGKTEPIAKALREALRWTGKERMAPDTPVGK